MIRKYLCPDEGCKHGNIIKCQKGDMFEDGVTFTNESQYPTCPRWIGKKTNQLSKGVKA